jgi:hypothetical protein
MSTLLDYYKMSVQTVYNRFKAWWRIRQYVKELKSNTELFRWGTHEKYYDKNQPTSIGTLIANAVESSKNNTKV